jgi:GMP synthase (glutamine-hydrolysing)
VIYQVYKAVILGGSPFSVRGEDAPQTYLKLIRVTLQYVMGQLAHFSGGEASTTRIW